MLIVPDIKIFVHYRALTRIGKFPDDRALGMDHEGMGAFLTESQSYRFIFKHWRPNWGTENNGAWTK